MRALAALVLCASSAVLAYDSKCYRPSGAECLEGPDAARNRWIGNHDEHRELLQLAGSLSGLPAALFAEFELPVFVDGRTVTIGASTQPTLRPALPHETKSVQTRRLTIAELAQLPDFSHSLADWALGNETCPLNPFLGVRTLDAERCHAFRGHMGALNSSHFVPQSQDFYAHYHALALGRAADCRRLRDGVPAPDRLRFAAFFLDCQREALALEAVGQHYLQDAWSTGHMWERWGSPDPRAFPDLETGMLVALSTGITHGIRGMVQAAIESQQQEFGIGELALVDANDALCAPDDQVRYVAAAETVARPGVGDLYSGELLTNPRFDAQRAAFFSCSVSGLREVFAATGELPGAPGGTALRSVVSTSDECFGQRVTNAALRRGAGIDVTTAAGVAISLPLEDVAASGIVVALSEATGKTLTDIDPGELAARTAAFRHSMIRLGAQLTVFAKASPEGTSLASGLIVPIVGIDPNGRYSARQPPSPYIDPALPWSPRAETSPEEAWGSALSRTFHRAHALDWCHAFVESSALDLGALRSAVSDAGAATRPAACRACAEFAARHLRQGLNAGSYDRAQEPLCGYFESDGPVQFVYQPFPDGSDAGVSVSAAAQRWCGCSDHTVRLTIQPDIYGITPAEVRVFNVLPDGQPVSTAGTMVELSVDCGAVVPQVVTIGAQGSARFDLVPDPGCGLVTVVAVAREGPGQAPLAQATAQARATTVFQGTLILNDDDQLPAFSNLVEITGVLDVRAGLTVLDLPRLRAVQGVSGLRGGLTRVDLPALQTVLGEFVVGPSSTLTRVRVPALLNVTRLQFADCDVLTEFVVGPARVSSDLNIFRNAVFQDLGGLNALVSVGRHLQIVGNPALSTQAAIALGMRVMPGGSTLISGNGTP